MSNLSFFTHDYNGADVRVTEDRRFSVFDILIALDVATSKDVRMMLKRIMAANPEVVTACDYFKFPGRGQRETPVATEEVLYQILMLTPGGRAAAFREWAAGIIADPDKALDHAVSKYVRQGKSAKWIRERLDGKVARHKLTDTLQQHGVMGKGFAICTDALNQGLFGKTAKELKAERGVLSTRDGMDDLELSGLNFAERISERKIKQQNLQGTYPCADACRDAGGRVRRVMDAE